MSFNFGYRSLSTNLLFCMDAANIKCYPQTGRTLSDLAKNDQGSLDFITPNSIQWNSNNYGYFDFPTNNAYIGFTGLLPQTIKPQPPITIETWFQVYSGTNDFTAIVNIDGLISGNAQYRGFNIGISPVTSGLYYIGAGYGTAAGTGINNRKNLVTPTIYPVNVWKHVVAVLNIGLSMNLYIDGLSVTGTTSGNASFLGYGTAGFLELGKVNGGNPQYLSGRIAMAKVYNIAFTAEQALESYNSTKYRFGL
jgi:hypothetical protein